MNAEPVVQRWTFLGNQLTSRGIRQVWRAEDGQQHLYKGSSNAAPGRIYAARVDPATWTLHGVPNWTGDLADDAADIELTARSWAEVIAARRAEAAAKRNPQHARLVAKVADYAATLRSTAARDQLITELQRAVWRAQP